MAAKRVYLALVLVAILPYIICISHEHKLKSDLFKNYDKSDFPTNMSSDKVVVNLKLSLIQILSTDVANSYLKTNAWVHMEWSDSSFYWNPKGYDNIDVLRVSTSTVWTPDITLYNSFENNFHTQFESNCLIYPTSKVMLVPSLILHSTCDFNLTFFPFDVQKCFLKFGSWTYDGYQLDLQFFENNTTIDMSDYWESPEWKVLGTEGSRQDKFYPCCKEPYPDITYHLTLARKSGYYVLTLIVPTVLISLLTLMVFVVPATSGQKMTLGCANFIAILIMAIYLTKIVPMTYASFPVIAIYFTGIGFQVVFTLIMSALSLNFYHRDSQSTLSKNHLALLDALSKRLKVDSKGGKCEGKEEGDTESSEGNGHWTLAGKVLDRACFCLSFIFVLVFTFGCLVRMVNNI